MASALDLQNCRPRIMCGIQILALATALLLGATFRAEEVFAASAAQLQPATELCVPSEYGEIVYQRNSHCPRQIFIVGQSHRSALTGQAELDTVKVQTEIYRIGEWLIREKNVKLLLPEGFFRKGSRENLSTANSPRKSIRLDNQSLEAALSDTSRFVNSDMLLNSSYDIRLGQVEDEQLYRDIDRLLRKARQENSLSLLAKLDSLQDERTAVMLQNIPEVVEEAFRAGRIDNRRAMFTIGLAHVGDIINFLQSGSLQLPTDRSGLTKGQDAGTSLKLLDRGYGVTVIIPRTLAEDKQALRMCKLEAD
jgi:hypothetical protein